MMGERQSVWWAFWMLIRMSLLLPVYLVVVYTGIVLMWLAQKLMRASNSVFAASDAVHRFSGVQAARRWLDAR